MTDGTSGIEATAATGRQIEMSIQKVYVKDLSFEVPQAPAIFMEKWEPQVDLQLGQDARPGPDNLFEVTLKVTATVSVGEKVAYLAEVQQSGIFRITGHLEEELGPILGAACPNILFPFAREAISDLSTRGGFPPLVLSPVNFDGLYHEEIRRRKEAEAVH